MVPLENTTPVEPDRTPEDSYHFMTEMIRRAIAWMRYAKSLALNRSFFLYFAPGAMHGP